MPRPQVVIGNATPHFWSPQFWTMIDIMIRSIGSGFSTTRGADATFEAERLEWWNSEAGINMADDIMDKMEWHHEIEEDGEEEGPPQDDL